MDWRRVWVAVQRVNSNLDGGREEEGESGACGGGRHGPTSSGDT